MIAEIKSRLYYLDYLRSFAIILVVMVHSMLAYSQLCPEWWYVINTDDCIYFDFFILLTDRFLMPLLFFIAGYFALNSILKQKTILFLKKKFFRLFIPLILAIIFINPISLYVSNLNNSISFNGYLDFWIFTYLTGSYQLFHLWFLLLLVIFMFSFAIIYNFKIEYFHKILQSKSELSKKYLFLIIFVLSIVSFFINIYCDKLSWFFLGLVHIFQPTRLLFYIFFFSLGIYSFKTNFFSINDKDKGFLFWFSSSFILSIVIGAYYYFYFTSFSKFLYLQLISIILLWIFCLTTIFTLVLFFKRYLNRKNIFLINFSKNSYYIYILHYPFVSIFQYMLLNIQVSIFLKLFIVFSSSLFLSFILSNLLLFLKNYIFLLFPQNK